MPVERPRLLSTITNASDAKRNTGVKHDSEMLIAPPWKDEERNEGKNQLVYPRRFRNLSGSNDKKT